MPTGPYLLLATEDDTTEVPLLAGAGTGYP